MTKSISLHDWISHAYDYEADVDTALMHLLGGVCADEINYMDNGVHARVYDEWSDDGHLFTFDQVANYKEARVEIERIEAERRVLGEARRLRDNARRAEESSALLKSNELNELARLKEKYE